MNFVKIAQLAWDVEYNRNVKKADARAVGKLLVKKLPRLGPSFIKIGQFMSTRDDIFGKGLSSELAMLQDSAPPIDSSYVKSCITALSLKSFEEVPIATASIGQVHKGTLSSGEHVAIKVRRPQIKEEVKRDFDVILKFLEFLKVFSDNRRVLELNMVFKEYYTVLLEEIDFQKESDNIKEFAKNFKDVSWVTVPKVYPDLCNENVVVMDYVPSQKISEIPELYSPEECKNAVQKIIKCYIYQITQHNFVHIDPHPGNVGVTATGRLVFYDYGMVLDLSKEKIAERFNDFILFVFEKNADSLAEFLVDTGIIEVLPGYMPFFKSFVNTFIMYTDTLNFDDFKKDYMKQLESVGGMPFFISNRFVMLFRGLAILDGVLKKLYPDLNYQDILQPFVQERIMSLDYIESRALSDVKALQKIPSNMEVTQLQLEILQMTVNEQKRTINTMSLLSCIAGLLSLVVFLSK